MRGSRLFPIHATTTRRGFLASAAVGMSAILLPASAGGAGVSSSALLPIPTGILPAAPAVLVPLGGVRGEFLRRLLRLLSGAIDYTAVASDIISWFPRLSASEQTKVRNDHYELVTRGYLDPALEPATSVFGSRGSSKCVYYPADHATASASDGVAPFYDFCECTCRAQLASPSILGLASAAKDLASMGNSPAVVSGCLIPDSQSSASMGLWNRYYSRPDTYVSENGTRVSVNYEPDQYNQPCVAVRALYDFPTGTQDLLGGPGGGPRRYPISFS